MPSPVRARRFAAPRGLPLPNRTLRVLREGGIWSAYLWHFLVV
jgi:hypothetical protein